MDAKYASLRANGVAWWQGGTIAGAFQATCKECKVEPEMALSDFLGDVEPVSFWNQVDANFQAGRIKMVFVADVIPRELARIVESLANTPGRSTTLRRR